MHCFVDACLNEDCINAQRCTAGGEAPSIPNIPMNPKDFQGVYKYKLLIPTFEWASILCTFVGPVLFPTPWLVFVAAFMVMFFLTSSFQVRCPPRLEWEARYAAPVAATSVSSQWQLSLSLDNYTADACALAVGRLGFSNHLLTSQIGY
jgi:hypothetical protein